MSHLSSPAPARLTAWVTLVFLLVLSGCGDSPATMEATFAPADRFPTLSFEVQDEDGTRRFIRGDLVSNHVLGTGQFEVAEEGTIRIAIRVSEDGQPVAEGSLELAAREDFEWGVDFVYATSDPADQCFGCFGSASFEVAESFRTAPEEALWVTWGGRRQGSDVVF